MERNSGPNDHPFLVRPESLLVLFVDIQERFRSLIYRYDEMLHNIKVLAQAARELELPYMVSEQYPKGLGRTVSELDSLLQPYTPFEKTTFGCPADPLIRQELLGLGRKDILVCGIESHVCVLQTVLQLLQEGYRVYVARDAVSSRHPDNHQSALSLMERAGAALIPTESILFMLLHDARHPKFKALQNLIK